MAVLRITQVIVLSMTEGDSFTLTHVAGLRITEVGSFTYNTCGSVTCNRGWQFYLQHRVTVFRITQGGSFTYNTELLFYV